MNKIDPKNIDAHKIITNTPGSIAKRPASHGNGGFDNILIDQLEKGRSHRPSQKTVALPEIQGTYRAQAVNPEVEIKTQLTQRLNESIDLLETYASWLGKPERTLKQVQALLDNLLTQTKTLEQEFKKEAISDMDLNHILNQLAATVEVEHTKLNRGDYSD